MKIQSPWYLLAGILLTLGGVRALFTERVGKIWYPSIEGGQAVLFGIGCVIMGGWLAFSSFKRK